MNDGMFELAAREADGVVIHFVGPAQIAELAPRLREIRRTAGNNSPFEIIALIHAAADDTGDPTSVYRKEMAPYLAVPTYRRAAVALSSVEEVDTATEAWETGGREAAADAFPPAIVEAALAVGSDAIADRIQKLEGAGCDGIRFVPVSTAGTEPTPIHALVDCLSHIVADRDPEEVSS